MENLNVISLSGLYEKAVDGYIPVLFEIYNPDIVWTTEEQSVYGQEPCYLRLIADGQNVIYKGKRYLACNFEYTPPESDGSKISNASITISALDVRVKQLLRSIKLPSEIKVVSMFAKKTLENNKIIYKFVNVDSVSLTMNTASSNKTTATFNLDFDRGMSQNVPFDIATSERVPSTKG